MPETTVNVRIYKSTHERLKQLANNRRQDLIIVIDDVVREMPDSVPYKRSQDD